jgi:hypothetical protein
MPNDELSLYHQILLIALANKRFPDYESQHRSLARWFSATFSTPYADAERMPFELLLLHKLEQDMTDWGPKKVDNYFKKEFLTKKRDIQEEEVQKTSDESWMQGVAQKTLKEREKELKEAEDTMIKQKEELPEGVIPPPDISRKF